MHPKQRTWSLKLYDRASEFHGHGGPFMVIGLRMGLTALRILDAKGWFGLTCIATLHWSPPDSCILDGIQSSSGCTLGKRNITVEEGRDISAVFHSSSNTAQITLKPEIYSKIKNAMSSDAEHTILDHNNEELVNRLIEAEDSELFTVTKKFSEPI